MNRWHSWLTFLIFGVILLYFGITPDLTKADSISVIPQGNFAFIRDGNIWVISANGGEAIALTSIGGYEGVSWSPDGEKLAFSHFVSDPQYKNSRGPSIIGILDPLTKSERIVVAPQLTPDPSGTLYYRFWNPRWSPDGTTIYFISNNGTGLDASIETVSTETLQRNVNFRGTWSRGFDISPTDGMIVYHCSSWPDTLCLGNANGTNYHTLIEGRWEAFINFPSWRPDGSQIAFIGSGAEYAAGSVVYVTPQGNFQHIFPIQSVTPVTYSSPSFSPDGNFVAVGAGGTIFIQDIANGTTTLLTNGSHPSWGTTQTIKIMGIVQYPTGVGIPGVTVAVGSQNTTSDQDGFFTISDLPSGSYSVSFAKTKHYFYRNPYIISNASGTVEITIYGTRQPIMLVTGMAGSENNDLENDENLQRLQGTLWPYGYVKGVNLFYAKGTSPYKFQTQNGQVIHGELCNAYETVKSAFPTWNGHFDIIAHSYGGLRARAYLENKTALGKMIYDLPCDSSLAPPVVIRVDNLFTVGTPHGGELGTLPLATLIGISSLVDQKIPALLELEPTTRAIENLIAKQPNGVCYRLIVGDARGQRKNAESWVTAVLWDPIAWISPNDMAVHKTSAQDDLAVFRNNFPHIDLVQVTDDIHGRSSGLPGLNSLKSYFDPPTTAVDYIIPKIGNFDCPENPNLIYQVHNQSSIQTNLIIFKTTGGFPWVDLKFGQIAASEVVSGNFNLPATENTQVKLNWLDSDLQLTLTDPLGNPITANTLGVDYARYSAGFGWESTYHFDNMTAGNWSYTITGTNLSRATSYRLSLIPSTSYAVSLTLPDRLPLGSPVLLQAKVTNPSHIPVAGGDVSARILFPDGTVQTVSLLDDGAHDDDQSSDGTFGLFYNEAIQGGVYGVQVTASGNANNQIYTHTATGTFIVAPNSASIGSQISDRGIDENGDVGYEFLEVLIPLVVEKAGTFLVFGELFAEETFITHTSMYLDLRTGGQTASIHFLWPDIFLASRMGHTLYAIS